MAIKPILFSTSMVKAERKGRKTQTRRTQGLEKINEDPDRYMIWKGVSGFFVDDLDELDGFDIKPKFETGDILWVRENFCTPENWDHWNPAALPKGVTINYQADMYDDNIPKLLHRGRWRPSIHMPKKICRRFLEVTDVRVERLHDISNEDAKAEGIKNHYLLKDNGYEHYTRPDKFIPFGDVDSARTSFFSLWMSINGAASLDANPWVWVYDFKRTDEPANFLK